MCPHTRTHTLQQMVVVPAKKMERQGKRGVRTQGEGGRKATEEGKHGMCKAAVCVCVWGACERARGNGERRAEEEIDRCAPVGRRLSVCSRKGFEYKRRNESHPLNSHHRHPACTCRGCGCGKEKTTMTRVAQVPGRPARALGSVPSPAL